MRKTTLIAVVIITCTGISLAQTQPPQQKTLAAAMNVYVFPTEGQTAQQQSTDEASCYDWAVQNTGSDPFALQKQSQQQQQQADQTQQQIAQSGAGAGAVGAVIARRRTAHKKEEASEQVEQQSQQAQQATAEQIDNFKKAFSVCLEAKKYMVKY